MKRAYLYILLALLSSCQTIDVVKFEVLYPAKITLPPTINSALIVNNSLIEGDDTFSKKYEKNYFILDTLTSQQIVGDISYLLTESPRFENCVLLDDIYFRSEENIKEPIAWPDVNLICTKYKTDALIALELLSFKDTLLDGYYYDENSGQVYDRSMALISNAYFRIYDNVQRKVVESAVVQDTFMFWGTYKRRDLNKILERSSAREYLSNQIASSISMLFSDRIAPYWMSVSRNYFINGHPDMKQGAEHALKDNWEDAALYWKKQVNNDNKKLAGAACHNLAVASEVLGKPDIALSWVNKALSLYNNQISQQYKLILTMRVDIEEKLNKQFNR